LKTPHSIQVFEQITVGAIVASVCIFIYQNMTTKLFGPTAPIHVVPYVIINLALIYTITKAKSIVSRAFYTVITIVSILFSVCALFGIALLVPIKVEAGVAAYLFMYIMVAIASLYLLYAPSSTKWLQSEEPVTTD
jgi:uncharacterized membrane protein YuzA (DUF378 family)